MHGQNHIKFILLLLFVLRIDYWDARHTRLRIASVQNVLHTLQRRSRY